MSDATEDDACDLVEDKYFSTNDAGERHRGYFIIEHIANADIDRPTLVRDMDAVFQWLKAARVPAECGKPQKLQAVTR
jgi:hypothetical protein